MLQSVVSVTKIDPAINQFLHTVFCSLFSARVKKTRRIIKHFNIGIQEPRIVSEKENTDGDTCYDKTTYEKI